MGKPSEVTAKLGVVAGIALALLALIGVTDRVAARARAHEPGATTCVDPSLYARSVVSIAWYFDKARTDSAGKKIIGERASACFYTSPRLLVTAAHFANDIPDHGWQEVELQQAAVEGSPEVTIRAQVRIVHIGRPGDGNGSRAGQAEDLALLELQDPFPDAQPLGIRPEPPLQDESVLVVSYPGGELRFANGIVRNTDDPAGKYAGLSLLEVQGSNRLLLGGGASGGPVLDCRQGRVMAVLQGLLTSPSLPFLPANKVIPTPWGSPTNTAVPAGILDAIDDRAL